MASFTAQILVGSGNEGIRPSHYLFLSENDRAGWVLVPQNVQEIDGQATRIVWVGAGPDRLLEDAFLMIAIHVQHNVEVTQLAMHLCSEIVTKDRVELQNLTDSQLEQLYARCRCVVDYPKLIISVFRNSYIDQQLKIIELYKMNVDVTRTTYSRSTYSDSVWLQQKRCEGLEKSSFLT